MSVQPTNSAGVAALIDHTLLKAEATRNDIERICREALQYRFASVCVNSVFVNQVSEALRNSPVKTCVVVGFPLGANLPAVKLDEARVALEQGAQEIDMVIHIGALKAGDDAAVRSEIESLSRLVHERRAILKVIIETALLSEEEKVRACRAARDARADFVKTSTGFSTSGATLGDVELMRCEVGGEMGVKASGGVRTLDDLMNMVDAGATRIGTSNGVKIVQEALAKFGT
ncbi:MAG TPA: deoxyribose-phosphate aldolase [Candidatus Acidoferrales bacterium]|nr:deoxyribose-phosphate aldolase [Candidatus Acidoferrales bacterium]